MDEAALQQLLFVNIETVSAYPSLDAAPAAYVAHWQRRVESLSHGEGEDEVPYSSSALYAEFGRIVCLSLGYIYQRGKGGEPRMRITTFAGNEQGTLQAFMGAVRKFSKQYPRVRLCAHNGNGFDFPYLARRLMVHRMTLPAPLRSTGRKPWEVPRVDTMEMWQYGERRSHVSLELLAYTLGIADESPVLGPEEVHKAYYAEGNMAAIAQRSQHEVVLTAQVFLHLTSNAPLRPEQLEILAPQLISASDQA